MSSVWCPKWVYSQNTEPMAGRIPGGAHEILVQFKRGSFFFSTGHIVHDKYSLGSQWMSNLLCLNPRKQAHIQLLHVLISTPKQWRPRGHRWAAMLFINGAGWSIKLTFWEWGEGDSLQVDNMQSCSFLACWPLLISSFFSALSLIFLVCLPRAGGELQPPKIKRSRTSKEQRIQIQPVPQSHSLASWMDSFMAFFKRLVCRVSVPLPSL